VGFAREHHVRFDRVAEVLSEDALQTALDVRLQGIADVEMLAFYGKLHWLAGPDGRMKEHSPDGFQGCICRSRAKGREHILALGGESSADIDPPFPYI
jgi:hypothetical protein